MTTMESNSHTKPTDLIFDGHNDVLTALMEAGGVAAAGQFMGETNFHVDRNKAVKGGLRGGFFALWVASVETADYQSMMVEAEYDVPLPPAVSQHDALLVVAEQISILLKLQAMNAVQICTSVESIKKTFDSETLSVVLHLEGCEAIDTDLHVLDVLYAAGLRSLGPVWSRNNLFAHGVPFRFPSTPDIGLGLTEYGVGLVNRCNELGILIDLSHINLAGFHDVAKHSKHPLVATHSNAHALCPHARNLTDEQLDMIRASNGMVGLNFASAFLRTDGRMIPDVPVEQMIRHLDYLIEAVGEKGVGLGSDFDGAEVPNCIGSTEGLPILVAAMRKHGYGEELIARLCHGNWLECLERTWNAS